ncbi:MAG: spore germination protein [Paenibacillaceae bacterium]
MSQSVNEKIQIIKGQMGESSDLIARVFQTSSGQQGALLFLEGLTDQDKIDRLFQNSVFAELKVEITVEKMQQKFPISDIQLLNETDQVLQAILSGKTALILEQVEGYFLLGLQKWAQRSPERPIIDSTVKGAQEGFVETLTVNISLVRRFLKSPSLRVEEMSIGKLSETKVSLLYVEGIARTEVLKEVRQRLKQIETDVILSSSNIEQWIEDNSWSIFPLVRITERPDVTVASLVEGKVAILTDHSPFALVVPFTFFDSLQNMDDYYEKWQVGILFRLVRFVAFMISFLLPGLYVALAHYNPGLIPTELLLSMITTLANVPFLLVVELLLMELAIEIFREAGMRLPKPVGQTIGIVGGIVIGDAAVRANLVSPTTLIVVALTAMASYSAPLYSLAHTFRIMRFLLILVAGVLGLYGYFLGVLMIIGHLASLKSFGVPYLSPMAPACVADWVDNILIFPQRWRNRKPGHLTQPEKKSSRKPLKEG